MYKPKVYTASKLWYSKLWKDLRADAEWDFVEFTATWVDSLDVAAEVGGEQPSPEAYRDGWTANVMDVKRSDFVLIYGKDTEALRGALVECGIAFGIGLPVLVVGITAEAHPWTYHPLVRVFHSLREARLHLLRFTTMVPPASRKRKLSDE